MNTLQMDARKKSLESLMAEMDEDEAKRLPGVTITVGLSKGPGEEEKEMDDMDDVDDMGGEGEEYEHGMDPRMAEIIKKKRMGISR